MSRYLFIDMNSFFASVEQQERPALRGQPLGVVPTRVLSTCCIAASYEAKAFGIKTGTPLPEALRLCPTIRFVVARPEVYVAYHHRIIAAVESCLHVERVCSIDEMYGRLIGSEQERAEPIARHVKATIAREAGPCLRCSIGLAPNPWLAKVASDLQKPDGLTLIPRERLPEILYPLKLTDLPGIAENMERRLARSHVLTVRQLCALTEKQMAAAWGSKVAGTIWWHQLRGYDLPWRNTHRRTVGHSHVLPPQWRTTAGAHAVLTRMIHKAASRLRRIGYWAGRLDVMVRFLGGNKWERHAGLGLCRDTQTLLEGMERCWRDPPAGVPFQVAVVLTELVPDAAATRPLFADQTRRDELARVMDRIDARHGRHTIYFGGMFGAKQTAPTRISFTQIPTAEELGEIS